MKENPINTDKLSEAEQAVAEKMMTADITHEIPLAQGELEALITLMGKNGVIIEYSNGNVTAKKY